MFKTIIVALDGSDGSKQAVPFARELASREGARLVIAHVEEDIVGKGGGPIHATEDEIQAEIRQFAKDLSDDGVETSVEMASVRLGGPAPAIAEIAEKQNADLIVCGTRGHSAIAGVLLGSVAERLLHVAKQPVFIVPEGATPKAE